MAQIHGTHKPGCIVINLFIREEYKKIMLNAGDTACKTKAFVNNIWYKQ